MDIHQQLLGVAGSLRTGARQAPVSVATELSAIADRIDPNRYAPGTTATGDAAAALRSAIADLDAIPDRIRPTSVPPTRATLHQILARLEQQQ